MIQERGEDLSATPLGPFTDTPHITPPFPLNSVHSFGTENQGSLPNKGLSSLNVQVPGVAGRYSSDAVTLVVLWNFND